jgi:integration host factor subunit beta
VEILTVTKKEIVKQISERSGLTQLKTKEIVQWTFDAIIQTLITEKRIELRNFGVFEVKRREARKARNPRTGHPVEVGPKNVVTFQPGKEMEEQVRDMALVAEKPSKTRKKSSAAAISSLAAAKSDGASVAAPLGESAPATTAMPAGHGTNGMNGDHAPPEPPKKRRAKKEVATG